MLNLLHIELIQTLKNISKNFYRNLKKGQYLISGEKFEDYYLVKGQYIKKYFKSSLSKKTLLYSFTDKC